MIASKITEEILRNAAQEIGVKIELDSLNASKTRFRVKLYPLVPADALTPSGRRKRGEKGDAPYQRTSASGFRDQARVNAVCWHGFRDFFRTCFVNAPDAVFRTAFDTWKGSADFEMRYQTSAYKNVGSQMYPRTACEVCRCGEEGYAR